MLCCVVRRGKADVTALCPVTVCEGHSSLLLRTSTRVLPSFQNMLTLPHGKSVAIERQLPGPLPSPRAPVVALCRGL